FVFVGRRPCSPLFPYTTLFRSTGDGGDPSQVVAWVQVHHRLDDRTGQITSGEGGDAPVRPSTEPPVGRRPLRRLRDRRRRRLGRDRRLPVGALRGGVVSLGGFAS